MTSSGSGSGGSARRGRRRGGNDDAVPREAQRDALSQSIRERRESLGLSLRALAERTGISPSALSHIENGRSQPSVSTLFALVRELNTTLDGLFGVDVAPAAARPPQPSGGTTVVRHGDPQARVQLGAGITWERLAGDPDVEFLRLTYEPGAASCPAGSFVRHGGREYGLVLRGRLRLTLGMLDYDLGPGDSVRFEAHLPHRLANDGDELMEAAWMMAGRNGGPAAG